MKHGRNSPCPCGSGKKYKKCCLDETPAPVDLLYRRLSETHDRLVDRLMNYAVERFEETAVAVAMAEFLLWPDEACGEDFIEQHQQLFWPWFFFNWINDPEDTPLDLNWPVDQTIPALNGKTPRQAVKTTDGRESVMALLLDAELNLAEDPHMSEAGVNAINKIRRKLGLEASLKKKLQMACSGDKARRVAAIQEMIRVFGRKKLNDM